MRLPRRPALPLLCAAALALALAACAGAPAPRNASFRLAPHQRIALADGATLTYDGVSDSRCPPDVQCIWAGKLSYQFIVEAGGARETFSLGPGEASHASAALHGKRIVLDESAIPPPRQSQAAPAGHPVTLKVEDQ